MTLTELLESVRRVEVRTNRLVNDTMGGAYLSGLRESGWQTPSVKRYLPLKRAELKCANLLEVNYALLRQMVERVARRPACRPRRWLPDVQE